MTNLKLKALLRKLGACADARMFVAKQSLAEAWNSCQRADWMLWLCGKMADKEGWPSRKQVVLAACACAETALTFVKKGEKRPVIAIETARKWTRGEATIKELRAAAASAAAAADAAYSAYAAAYSAYSAADSAAAYSAADAAYSAYAAAAAAAAAYADARAKALAEMADIIRSILTVPREDK